MASSKIMEHEFVPKHRKLTVKEVSDLLEKLGIKKENLPRIFSTDPAAKAISAKRGNILEITRASITAGESVYYRLVV